MFELSVKEILEATNGRLVCKGMAEAISGISTDTRKLKEGDLFVALKGENFDGHNFVDEAVKKGAVGAIIRFLVRGPRTKDKVIAIQVKDTLKAFGDIARHYRMKFNIPLIGITGSTGKTTAKEMIYNVLSSSAESGSVSGGQFNVLKNEGTENNLIGLPQTLLRLDATYKIGVLELGTNHFGEMKRLARILMPTTAIVSNIGPSHLEFLKSERGVFREKIELLKSLSKDGLAVINGDDAMISKINRLKCRIIRFGMGKDCDFRATKILQEKNKISFTVNGRYNFEINLLGSHNVYNALIAISIGFLYGVSLDNIYKGLSEFQPVSGRLCLKRLALFDVIDDTYNSNPQSIKASLAALSDYKSRGRKIFVCADMLELGKDAAKFHAEAGEAASKAGVDYLIAVGAFSETMKEAAILGGMSSDCVFSCVDNTQALEVLKKILKENDVLLLKGSRRMKLNEVVDAVSSFVSPKRVLVRV